MSIGLERDFTVTIMSVTYSRVGNLVTYNVMRQLVLVIMNSFYVIT